MTNYILMWQRGDNEFWSDSYVCKAEMFILKEYHGV
jgi:hypothetical protein